MTQTVAINNALAPSLGNTLKTTELRILEFGKALDNARAGNAVTSVLTKFKSTLKDLRERMAETAQSSVKVGDAVQEQKPPGDEKQPSETGRETEKEKSGKKATLTGGSEMKKAISAPIKAAMAFDTVLSDLKKTVDFDSPAAFKQMGRDILNMTRVVPMAGSGIAEIVAAAGKAGVARKELLGFSESAAKMGMAFGISGKDSVKMMTGWRSSMDLSQAGVISLGDAVSHLSKNMKLESAALGQVLEQQGAMATAAGFTETQVASLGAALLATGASPEKAAGALKNLTQALTAGEAATQSQKDAFGALGLDAEEMARAMKDDAAAATQTLFQAISQQPKEKQSRIVKQLFGEDSAGAVTPLVNKLDSLGKAFDLTAEKTKYAGAMGKAFQEKNQTVGNQLVLFKNTVSAVGIELGDAMLSCVNMAVGGLMDLGGGVSVLTETFPLLGSIVSENGVDFKALGKAATDVKNNFKQLSEGWQTAKGVAEFLRPSVIKANAALVRQQVVTTALQVKAKAVAVATRLWAGAQWVLNAAMSANPVGLIIAGVAALIGLGVYLYNRFESVRTVFDSIWAGVKKAFSFLTPVGMLIRLGTLLYKKFEPVRKLFDGVWGAVKKVGGAIGRFLLGDKGDEEAPKKSNGRRSRLDARRRAGGVVNTVGAGIRKHGSGKIRKGFAGTPAATTAVPAISLAGTPTGSHAPVAPPGLVSRTASQSGKTNITYSPTINITSCADAHEVREAAGQGLMESESRFKDMFERIERNERRLSYC